MKSHTIAAVIICVFAAEGAVAACSAPSTQVTNRGANRDLTDLLNGNTVCASRGGDRWQEEHHGGGVLKDFKMGPTDTVDPTTQVGTWAISGNSVNTIVTYNYGAGGSYSFTVWNNGGGSYSFCTTGGVLEMDFTIRSGTGIGCP